MASYVSPEREALRSYALPSSPCRSPTGAESMCVWVEEADGEQCVRVALADEIARSPRATPPLTVAGTPQDVASPPLKQRQLTVSTDVSPSVVKAAATTALDFPLELYGDSASVDTHSPTSAAIVPFQKLQMDTNLHQTTLPQRTSPTTSGNSSPIGRSAQFASPFRASSSDCASSMAQDFMQAMRLGDIQSQEPQLSVRLRGSRVELASGSEDESVDFLGPAENMKKLFKLPYSQARVSLAVHRVGGTLVVDGELNDADLPAGFDDVQESRKKIEQPRGEQADNTTQGLLYKKFIYQSAMMGRLTNTGSVSVSVDAEDVSRKVHKARLKNKKSKKSKQRQPGVTSEDGQSEEGKPQTEAPQSEDRSSQSPSFNEHGSPSAPSDLPTFQRVLRWKFHDLKMILGSEVLLFSNPEHPAVSLRLHDMDKELSLCTVLDYYLDNVIANIPELAICMHSKGFVRGYKLVETRQIPYLSGTGTPLFDIQEVSMNASMLLKFLKENCTRPNGTYWLYRNEGENSLRLYDVNVLSEGKQLKWKYMMAMLCYRFASRASRMIYSLAAESPHLQKQLRHRQRDLLRTCNKLLEEISQAGGAAHNSICSSVSEQLADSYLRECDEMYSHPSSEDQVVMIVKSLNQAKACLQESIRSLEQCMTGSRNLGAISPDGMEQAQGDEVATPDDDGDGNMESFMLEELTRLQSKCGSICLHLSQIQIRQRDWDSMIKDLVDASAFLPATAISPRVIPLVTPDGNCSKIEDLMASIDFDGVGNHDSHANLGNRICISGFELRCMLLEVLGDAASVQPLIIATKLRILYEVISGESTLQVGDLPDLLKGLDAKDSETTVSQGALLKLAFSCYLRALTPAVDSELYFRLMKKLGNSCNELGKHYLSNEPNYPESFLWFERGCRVFRDIEDGINAALLYANLAHLHKILAQGKPLRAQEEHYGAAVELCKVAGQLFKQNKADDELNRKVSGELALTHLVWAVAMSSRVPERDEDKRVENEVHKMFGKALSLYSGLGDSKQVASTHYQIAAFYSRLIAREVRQETASTLELGLPALKQRMEIARRHYEKALDYFGKVEVGRTFVLILQELSDLYAMGGRVEDVDHALLVLLNTFSAFSNPNFSRNVGPEDDGIITLANSVKDKIKLVLHQLIRLSAGSSSTAKTRTREESSRGRKPDVYKQMYKELIYHGSESTITDILSSMRSLFLL